VWDQNIWMYKMSNPHDAETYQPGYRAAQAIEFRIDGRPTKHDGAAATGRHLLRLLAGSEPL